MPETFRCKVITPEGPVIDRQAISVVFPASDGLVGVWPNHGAMIALVGEGFLTLRASDERAWFLKMDAGFAEVRDNVLTIMAARTGELLEQSDEAVEKHLTDAQQELAEEVAENQDAP